MSTVFLDNAVAEKALLETAVATAVAVAHVCVAVSFVVSDVAIAFVVVRDV
jgi:hypothetical protein